MFLRARWRCRNLTSLYKSCGLKLLATTLAITAITLQSPATSSARLRGGIGEGEICDPLADYYLGMEDYTAAIRQHQIVIDKHHDNALAYYHLGFAYGMIGDHQRELADYQRAVALGLSDWELFLNLGLAYMEAGRLDSASDVLRIAVLM